MEAALEALLAADAAVAAIVGARIYPIQRPQGSATPALVIARTGGGHSYTYTGVDGLVESRVQIDAWAERYGDAKALARAVTAALSGYRASTGTIRSAFLFAERDGLTPTDPGGSLARVLLDFTIWHQEA